MDIHRWNNSMSFFFSDTYTKVQQNANLSWLQMQIDLFEEYRVKTVFPKHLQLLALPGSLLAIIWFCCSFLRNKYYNVQPKKPKINDHPVFVRGMLSNISICKNNVLVILFSFQIVKSIFLYLIILVYYLSIGSNML